MLPERLVRSTSSSVCGQWLFGVAIGVTGLVLSSPAAAALQAHHQLNGPTCVPCRIDVAREAVLGDDAAGIVGQQFTIHRDAHGRYLVSHLENADEIVVFDSRGRFLRTVGRRGRGPGEFRGINWITGSDSAVFVFDGLNQTITQYTSAFELRGVSALPGQVTGAVVLSNHIIVLNANIMTRDRAGYALHVLDDRGNIVKSLDGSAEGFRTDFAYMTMRRLARAGAKSFWSAPVSAYRFAEYDVAGGVRRDFERNVDWFKPYVSRGIVADPKVPPQPMLKDIHVDRDGLLWVIVNVADPAWHKAVVPDPIGPTGYGWNGNWNQFFDTIVEVIDPASAQVIASRRLDQCLWRFAGPNIAASYKPPDGAEIVPRLELWRLALFQPSTHKRR